jgi:flagellar biosynthetic protein FlhB
MYEDADKTEVPTQAKRLEARQAGKVARSGELTAAVAMLAIVLGLHGLAPRVWNSLGASMERQIGDAAFGRGDGGGRARVLGARTLSGSRSLSLDVIAVFTSTFAMIAGLMLALWLISWLAAHSQVRFLWTTKPLGPDMSRLGPGAGLKRMFGGSSLLKATTLLIKFVLLLGVAIWSIKSELPRIIGLAELPMAALVVALGQLLGALVLKIALLLVGLGLIDYLIARVRLEQDLRMTRQELKDQMKRMEIDPIIRNRRQRTANQLSRQIAGEQLSGLVGSASLVVIEQDQCAVALFYDPNAGALPRLVAKGDKQMGMRIQNIARARAVPVIQNATLARQLIQDVETGKSITASMIESVAAVMAHAQRIEQEQEREREQQGRLAG